MRVGVVGGGVVGLATAHFLKKRGVQPIVAESGALGGGCSLGNGGWVCPSISGPLPGPDATLTAMVGMLRSDSPLHIRPAAIPQLARWLVEFRSHCNEADQRRGFDALGRLAACTMERYDELAADGVDFESFSSGLLMAYRDSKRALAARGDLKRARALGTAACVELEGRELHQREPMLRPGFRCGLFLPEERHVRPETLTAGLGAALRRDGAEVRERTPVTGFRREGLEVRAMVTPSGDVDVDGVVLAAGAHTGFLARTLGWSIPLTAGKGYSVTVERPRRQLRQPLYLAGSKIVLTPFRDALRFAGTMELSGINEWMDLKRVRSLRRTVDRHVDVAEAARGGREWVGMRPMAPDSLPVIGRLPNCENVYVNTGHQMLGVTLAPSSGRALADLIVEGRSDVDLAAFGADRFRQ